jgi:predicted permease
LDFGLNTSGKTEKGVKPHLWLIRLIGVIVPRRLRLDWRQEWEAELQYRERLLEEWDRLDWRNKFDLSRRSLGAFRDALLLQPQRLEDEMFQDLQFGIRMLLKKPAFTLIAIVTLGLGVGASTAIFSVVNPILFEPLPYPQSGKVMMIWDRGTESTRLDVTFGTYREVAERSQSFDALAVIKPWQPTLTNETEPERLDGQSVSASYFRVLGMLPALGQNFDSGDDRMNGARVVVLSDGLWRRRFGGDSAIIGRQITLNDNLYTVIAVMPSDFENVLAPTSDLWTLLQYDSSLPLEGREWGHHLQMVGRLRQGVGTDQARRDLDQIAQSPMPEFSRAPWAALKNGLTVNSLQDDITRDVKPVLLIILGAVLLVLVVACVNVTNLLLARGAQRRGEFSLRAALGAGRTRMLRQLLTESLLLAVFGGAVGMLVAKFGIQALIALSPPSLPRANAIGLDVSVFAFGLGLTTLIGLAVGLIPAFQASHIDLHNSLQQSSQRTVGSHYLTRRTLVVAEVALALVLLVSAGLMLRSVQRLFSVNPGFEASHLLTMQVQTSSRRFDDQQTTKRFFEQALEAVRQVPGVTMAAFTSQLPLSGDFEEYGVHFESSPINNPEEDGDALRYAVSPGYIETMGIPLRRGRLLDARDTAGAPVAVLINESFAKRKFPGQDPLGERLHLGRTDLPWYTIVGIVGDVKQRSLAVEQADAVYIANAQWYAADPALSLVVRAEGDARVLTPAIRKAIWSVDKDQPIVRVTTMDKLVTASAAERWFTLILFEAFGLVALVLAAIGIYGVLAGSVTERTREMGVRMALGAQRHEVLGLVLRQGVNLTIIGIGIGLVAAWATTRLLTKLLYSVSATDPLTFAGVALLLMVVALFACYLPARRATKVDPLVALRHE